MKKVYISITNPEHWRPEYYLHICTRMEQVYKIKGTSWDALGGLYFSEYLQDFPKLEELRAAFNTYKVIKGPEKRKALKELKALDLHVAKVVQRAKNWFSIIFGLLSEESQKKVLLHVITNKQAVRGIRSEAKTVVI